MYLKEIKAYGFKSFADKINIEFGKNINGIVGPNGTIYEEFKRRFFFRRNLLW